MANDSVLSVHRIALLGITFSKGSITTVKGSHSHPRSHSQTSFLIANGSTNLFSSRRKSLEVDM